jgi:alpha-tubulin suppressor-like RCC1 family protein
VPTAVLATSFDSRTVKDLFVGGFHACVILGDESVQCWGRNTDGQLGLGTDRTHKTTAVDVTDFGPGRSVKSLALGGFHTCAILDDDSVKCWGYNYYGQLGIGTTTDTGVPTTVNLGAGRGAKRVFCGGYTSCVILDDDSVKCWGYNENGGLGDGTTTNRDSPVALPSFGSGKIKDLFVGGHSCVVFDDSTVKCWGRNTEGQLGLGTDRTHKTTAVDVTDFGPGRSVKSLALGGFHTCAILDDDSVKCWGRNSNGQLGIGTTTDTGVPTTVNLGAGRSAMSLSLGGYVSCAVLEDGSSMKCWGWNPQGQVGDGTTVDRLTPTLVLFP